MQFTYDGRDLTVSVDADERETLERWSHLHLFDSDETMHEWFEDALVYSEYDWIFPVEFGDLTDAPMLCFVYNRECRFGYMDYQINSVLSELLQEGYVTFTGV